MLVIVNKAERKLMAVRSLHEGGLFLRNQINPKHSVYFTAEGCDVTDHTLEELLAESSDRTPVYEGDSVTIQF